MSNLWRSYEWTTKAVGRAKGKIESRAANDPATIAFLARGWIKEVGQARPSAPEPAAAVPDTKEIGKAPRNRAVTRSATETK